VVRPRRLAVWRTLHGTFATVIGVIAALEVRVGAYAHATFEASFAFVFAMSAIRAPQRLDAQVARLAQARDRNAPEAGTTGTA
jgi:hypothetical protein